ncbi:toll/interleukin-1 receptor domain-containing protein [Streptomyces sp. NPDC051987]|uniref:toll/interleukin-1 receptor domain-containing protein n=1 Tax=Streptomyces sp. NPDC051987 TaxID=3155808 RepID=UPI0034381819
MTPSLFTNFRRADTGSVGPHIDTKLQSEFGARAAFRDQRSLPKGHDFRDQLERAIRKCDLLLVVMGDRWASVRDTAGRRLIDREDDWVRREIALAGTYKLPVIPILVDQAQLPDADELPEDIRYLAYRQAVYFRPHQEHIDFPPLLAAIREAVPGLGPTRRGGSGGAGGTGTGGGDTFTIERMDGNAIFGGRNNSINHHGSSTPPPSADEEDDDQERP